MSACAAAKRAGCPARHLGISEEREQRVRLRSDDHIELDERVKVEDGRVGQAVGIASSTAGCGSSERTCAGL